MAMSGQPSRLKSPISVSRAASAGSRTTRAAEIPSAPPMKSSAEMAPGFFACTSAAGPIVCGGAEVVTTRSA